MSKSANPCPTCGMKRSPAATLCPQCDKESFLTKCKNGYDALDTMPGKKLFWIMVLSMFCNMLLPGLIVSGNLIAQGVDLSQVDAMALLADSVSGIVLMILGQFAAVAVFLIFARNYLPGVIAKCINKKTFLAACVVAVIMIAIGFGWDWIKGLMQISVNENTAAITNAIGFSPFLLFIQTVLGAALAEEVVFRACMFSILRRKNKVLAYIVSAVFFALVHVSITTGSMNELISLPIYIVLGLILAYAYEKYGLLGSIIPHALNNLVFWLMTALA